MKTIRKVRIEPIYVEFMPDFKDMEEAKIYISGKYKTAIHRCLCGCGLKTALPLDCIIDGVDHGWKLIKENKEGTIVSFTPSVGNFQYPCKSHYIITKNVANFV